MKNFLENRSHAEISLLAVVVGTVLSLAAGSVYAGKSKTVLSFAAGSVYAGKSKKECKKLPDWGTLHTALCSATTGTPDCSAAPNHGGFNLHMWATVVNRDGIVCAVTFTGSDRGDQWPGSRIISAQKANTANAFGLPGFAISTAQLWEATRDQGSLADLTESNPVDTKVAYQGPSKRYGQKNDPMVGKKIGGVNDFGGGFALYGPDGIIGALGVSGDSSCEDHVIGWNTRKNLGLDNVPGGPATAFGFGTVGDELVFTDTTNSNGTGGFGHPHCLGHGVDNLNNGEGVVD